MHFWDSKKFIRRLQAQIDFERSAHEHASRNYANELAAMAVKAKEAVTKIEELKRKLEEAEGYLFEAKVSHDRMLLHKERQLQEHHKQVVQLSDIVAQYRKRRWWQL